MSRRIFRGCLLAVMFGAILSGCSTRLHEAAPNADTPQHEPWLVHCETTVARAPMSGSAPGSHWDKWITAQDSTGAQIILSGSLNDGYLQLDNSSHNPTSLKSLRATCLSTLSAHNSSKAYELASIRAFRDSEGVDIGIIFPQQVTSHTIKRLVIFGDSLSDTGKLKRRLHVIPGAPYWLGRFSNGPNWVDYLEAWSELPTQNHAYGGASVAGSATISHQALIAFFHDEGQFFVSGSIDEQIEDYRAGFLEGESLQHPDETAFVIWAGANDYISKEPFTGAIDTLLNHPLQEGGYQAVVDDVIDAMVEQIASLYTLGARKILIANLSDLGRTPIVTQNQTFPPRKQSESDEFRRITLSQRLSDLTRHHNDQLAQAIRKMKLAMPEADIEAFDFNHLFSLILAGKAPLGSGKRKIELGLNTLDNSQILRHQEVILPIPTRCYTGPYTGSEDNNNICGAPNEHLFWDVIHPTTYAHCWTAYFFGLQMYEAGWLANTPDPQHYKTWCQQIGRKVMGHDGIFDALARPESQN